MSGDKEYDEFIEKTAKECLGIAGKELGLTDLVPNRNDNSILTPHQIRHKELYREFLQNVAKNVFPNKIKELK